MRPGPERDIDTLVTSGMSDRPMEGPIPPWRYAELMIRRPPSWPLLGEEWERRENHWPVRLLQFLCRSPHEYHTWLWNSHTVSNGTPPAPFASNTGMRGVVLLPRVDVDPEFRQLRVDDEKTIHFHCVVPLHLREPDFARQDGVDALLERFEDRGVTEVLDPGRACVVSGSRRRCQGWRWRSGSIAHP